MGEVHPIVALGKVCRDEPDYAWALFCNIAVPIMDAAGMSHKVANETAAHLMQHLFDHDITTHESYVYGKSDAQAYAEFRLAVDRDEDAALAREQGL